MRLKKAQKEILLSWVAEGLESGEINARAAKFEPPFSVSRAQVDYYRDRTRTDLLAIRAVVEQAALVDGYAKRETRIQKLSILAALMEKDLMGGFLWTDQVKGIGSKEDFQVVEYEEFNGAEVIQYRGVLDDIAKEVGDRTLKANEIMAGTKAGEALSALPADVLASSFLNVYRDARDRRHMEYLLKGGRGSTKSSFASLNLIYLLVNNPTVHALAMRQVANTLRDSVYSQIVWAISTLGMMDSFKCITSPLEIEYKPTGQKIYFRGADKPEMIKSIKPVFGHIGILWFEELDQFHGPEAIRKIEQSTLRGGEEAWEFKTYNPPRTAANWVNKYVQIPKANQYQHHSTYLDVPAEWLGQTFIDEATHLKSVNPTAYLHEYMGEVVGTGGMVFENVQIRKITDDEIAQFDRILMGNDWGYYPDPFAWVKCYYDAARLTLYIFDELKMQKAGNKETYTALVRGKGLRSDGVIISDSAEPKSIADYRQYSTEGIEDLDDEGKPKLDPKGKPVLLFGPSVRAAEKGPESVKYSMKWFQSLTAIVIDPERAPETANEFLNYELEQDKDGNFISEYPDRDNHFIDASRYATNLIWRRRGQ
jgi:PBSX family phage terminase large subunit